MKKILVVDDDPDILKLEKAYLEQEGYKVITANNGEEAKQLFKNQDFDLVMLDVMMPGIDGFELSKWIRENKAKGKVPIIFVSAKGDEESIKTGFKSGGALYLSKPFTKRQLINMVQVVIKE